MAGIGFELRKIFKDNTIVSIFKGFTSASFIAAGPMIISIILLISLDIILKSANVSMDEREIIKAAILYAYVFSMLVSSGYNMIISRYISDKLFINDTKDILSSFIGIITTVLIFAGLLSIVLYFKSPLPFLQKYFSYVIFVELVILNILMAYISAIKNYKQVVLSFVLGTITTLAITIFLIKFNASIVTGTIFSVSVGYFINIIILILALTQHFNILSKNLFSFIHYFRTHYKLFLINLLYTAGVFIHNILFWKFSNLSVKIKDTFLYAPPYDTASFFAVLTTIPAAVIFVVRFETVFYEKYRRFCDVIVEGGSLKDLNSAKRKMIDILRRELTFLIEIQLIITIVLTIIGVSVVLPIFANDTQAIELYSFLSIGYFMSYMTSIIIVILLYFDIQTESLIIASTFFISTIIFTLISIILGENYYGIGYDLSSLLSFILSLFILNKEINIIDYRLFSKR